MISFTYLSFNTLSLPFPSSNSIISKIVLKASCVLILDIVPESKQLFFIVDLSSTQEKEFLMYREINQ